MTPTSPKMLSLARRLIAHENGHAENSGAGLKYSGSAPDSKSEPSGKQNDAHVVNIADNFSALDKLRPHLVTLMSRVGYQALLARACVLAEREAAWLSALTIHSDGSLSLGTPKDDRALARKKNALPDAATITSGSHLFFAQVLVLLEAFIGEVLTLHLVSEVWPNVPLGNLDSDPGETLEKEI